MKNVLTHREAVLILHGAGNDSSGNWFPWLKHQLEKKSFAVWVPDLPNSHHPIQKDWLETVFSNPDWKFDEKSILIGHSAGATLILRILEQLPGDTKINKAILVAGYLDKGDMKKFWQYKEDLTREPFDWDKIKRSAEEFILICSDNDPYDCGVRHSETIKNKVGGELIIKKGEQHFNLESNKKYKQFPLLLEYI